MTGRLVVEALIVGRKSRFVIEVCKGDHLVVEESRAPDDIFLDVTILPTKSRVVFRGSTIGASLLTTAVVRRVMVQTPYTVPDSSDTSEAFDQTGDLSAVGSVMVFAAEETTGVSFSWWISTGSCGMSGRSRSSRWRMRRSTGRSRGLTRKPCAFWLIV
ncbi:hypothetical protein Y032_0005g2420 [Ancylostoma ceylanicum]|uniref:Uncharacterized protein n=1 Tax=Ancylostoma ceylanicum TaxID=53326 RepID=A0A016VSR6_9BILA|nr:hypothetical protein Y032_0005g2420 [Ancylostoma ceylanicum]